ncbi:MAG TPA: type II toxin-antitoxin system RelE/ParE family toxin [Candidatus Bathyarchaeia archaeon]|nr:type II toxin-antitoxin system RelE/ParE family toxin [Candidatus Bathyarchaeia archaeon]
MSKFSAKFNLLYTKTAVKDIQKLDRVVKKKIKKKIELYSQKPYFYARKLIKPSLGSYRWRIGKYRVVFDIDKSRIVILRIGHRKEIYS